MINQSRPELNSEWLHLQIIAAKYAERESDLEARLTTASHSSTGASTKSQTFNYCALLTTQQKQKPTWLSSPVRLKPKEQWDRLSESNPPGANATTRPRPRGTTLGAANAALKDNTP
jgi:hypothetical protein